MPLVSTTIPNLINGVSQQPDAVRLPSQCAEMVNCAPSIVEFLRRRPATRHIARLIRGDQVEAAFHVINRDAVERYIVMASADRTLRVFDLNGVEKSVQVPSGDLDYLESDHPSRDIHFFTIADYTFILNTTKVVAMSTEVAEKRPPEAIVFVKQVNYSTDFWAVLNGSKVATHSTPRDDKEGAYRLSSNAVATDLADQITKANTGFKAEVKNSTIHITRSDASNFSGDAGDSRSNTHIAFTQEKVQKFSDLPVVAPNGFVVEITGSDTTAFDNFYVRFETDSGQAFAKGTWIEAVAPGISKGLDAATMPHALIRQADGTFTVERMEWLERKVGDADSAPEPSFIGRTLNSMFLYQNRLGFLSGSNMILSEASEFFNFFPTTVTALIDSDPIDISASSSKVSILNHAIPFSEGLLLFSSQTQFLLEHGDVLSNKTAYIKPITDFDCSESCSPVGAGKNIFFATHRGEFSGIMEYYVEVDDASVSDAADITGHVPRYLKGAALKMTVNPNEDFLIVQTDGDRHNLHVYKYFWNGQEKVQSAWGQWIFGGQVLHTAFINSRLVLAVQYADGVYLETLQIEPGYVDEGCDFEYAIDRKITEAAVSDIIYNALTDESTLTFPYPLADAKKCIVVSRFNPASAIKTAVGRVFTTLSIEGSRVTVAGNLVLVPFFAGELFESKYTFSRQFVREETSSGRVTVLEGRLQLRKVVLSHTNTGGFKVLVDLPERKRDEYVFTAKNLGRRTSTLGRSTLDEGLFQVPTLCNSRYLTLSVVSESYQPFQFTGAGWEGFYHSRSGRM